MKQKLLFCLFFIFSLGLSAQSLASLGQAEDLRVFPNPVVEYFKVGNSDRVTTVRVTNSLGREVRRFTYRQNESYNISDLPRGFYLVQLRDDQNRILKTQRVSKR